MTTFRSKPGLLLILPVATILVVFGFIAFYNRVWIGLFIIILLAAFITHTFLTTYYQVDGRSLRIKSGFLFNKTISIESIREITDTKTPLSSPATSLDRLEIKYNKSDVIIVSPKNKSGFIEELRKIKPGIEVDTKA